MGGREDVHGNAACLRRSNTPPPVLGRVLTARLSRRMSSNCAYSVTFCDRAENHAGMQMIGSLADSGFSVADLEQAQAAADRLGIAATVHHLHELLPEQQVDGSPAADVLVLAGAAEALAQATVTEALGEVATHRGAAAPEHRARHHARRSAPSRSARRTARCGGRVGAGRAARSCGRASPRRPAARARRDTLRALRRNINGARLVPPKARQTKRPCARTPSPPPRVAQTRAAPPCQRSRPGSSAGHT